MPETITTPDFEQIAMRILLTIDYVIRDHGSAPGSVKTAIIEDLRLVWNARGAADIAAVKEDVDDPLYCHSAVQALRGLDR